MKRLLSQVFEEVYGFPPSVDELHEVWYQMQLYDLRPEEYSNLNSLTQGIIAAGFDTSNTTL